MLAGSLPPLRVDTPCSYFAKKRAPLGARFTPESPRDLDALSPLCARQDHHEAEVGIEPAAATVLGQAEQWNPGLSLIFPIYWKSIAQKSRGVVG